MPPTVLCEREKFAFMAPPAHTDPEKWSALRNLAEKHLSPEAIEDAGLLNVAAVNQLFALHEARDTSASTQVQLDAIINHMLGVQILHDKFIRADIPSMAARRAEELGWRAAN